MVRCLRVVLATACLMAPGPAAALFDYSFDLLSPENPGGTPEAGGIQNPDGTLTLFSRTALGLAPGVELNAFSFGGDSFPTVGTLFIIYSVTRDSVGTVVVNAESTSDGAAGDDFLVKIIGAAISPPVVFEAVSNGLTPIPPPPPGGLHSDLDAVSAPGGGGPPILLSLGGSANVLIQPAPGPGALAPTVWAATVADLGLLAGDDIDALAVGSAGPAPTIVFGDQVWVSLTRASPTLLGPDGAPGKVRVDDDNDGIVDNFTEFLSLGTDDISPAAILKVVPGPMTVTLPPVALELLPTDDLNALTAGDPLSSGLCGIVPLLFPEACGGTGGSVPAMGIVGSAALLTALLAAFLLVSGSTTSGRLVGRG